MRAIAWLALDCDARRGFPRQPERDRRREVAPRSSDRAPARSFQLRGFLGIRRVFQRGETDRRDQRKRTTSRRPSSY